MLEFGRTNCCAIFPFLQARVDCVANIQVEGDARYPNTSFFVDGDTVHDLAVLWYYGPECDHLYSQLCWYGIGFNLYGSFPHLCRRNAASRLVASVPFLRGSPFLDGVCAVFCGAVRSADNLWNRCCWG